MALEKLKEQIERHKKNFKGSEKRLQRNLEIFTGVEIADYLDSGNGEKFDIWGEPLPDFGIPKLIHPWFWIGSFKGRRTLFEEIEDKECFPIKIKDFNKVAARLAVMINQIPNRPFGDFVTEKACCTALSCFGMVRRNRAIRPHPDRPKNFILVD